ncbi:MAG TPA: hypothetical protein VNL72_00485 [Gammaproteobacteria bacterium]|nr:hypothetical protein [Gammaproteobacteria bacterium]
MAETAENIEVFDEASREAVELANRLAKDFPEADLWDIADGLLAGAVHYWLYSRQPCGDPRCEDCEPVATAEQRIEELLKLTRRSAEESEYYHSPADLNVGRA